MLRFLIICISGVGLMLATCSVTTWIRNNPEALFKRYIDNPIPQSVKNLAGGGYSGMTGAATYLSFNIAPDDLKRLIRDKGFQKKEQFTLIGTQFDSNPKFHMDEFLSFEREEGFGILLLKVSPDYRKVFFHYFRA